MSRILSISENQEFDVAIIGAGIHGAAIAWDAAQRGLKVALVDKGDFGAATSSGCFRIVHGGLRYLQHFDFLRLRESVQEQRSLRVIAPHLVSPLPFLVPCYGFGLRGKELLRIAAQLYELLASDRNFGVCANNKLPRARTLRIDECLALAPALSREALRGGLLYYDAQIQHCERLTFLFANAAAKLGAFVANYCKVSSLRCVPSETSRGYSIREMCCEDQLNGRGLTIRARHYVNASGPWVERVLSNLSYENQSLHLENLDKEVFSKGIQLVLPGTISSVALALESQERDTQAVISRGGRSYFLVPWQGQTLVGTGDALFLGDPDGFSISEAEVGDLLKEVARSYPAFAQASTCVRYTFGGLRAVPLGRESNIREQWKPGSSVEVSHRGEIRDHSQNSLGHSPIDNLLSVIGVKYTTARRVAEDVVDVLVRRGKYQSLRRCTTARSLLVQSETDDRPSRKLSHSTIARLRSLYASDVTNILRVIDENEEFAKPIGTSEILSAEVISAVRHEMALRLSDVVFRRTALGILGNPGEVALRQACELMKRELGWDDVRAREELDATVSCYPTIS